MSKKESSHETHMLKKKLDKLRTRSKKLQTSLAYAEDQLINADTKEKNMKEYMREINCQNKALENEIGNFGSLERKEELFHEYEQKLEKSRQDLNTIAGAEIKLMEMEKAMIYELERQERDILQKESYYISQVEAKRLQLEEIRENYVMSQYQSMRRDASSFDDFSCPDACFHQSDDETDYDMDEDECHVSYQSSRLGILYSDFVYPPFPNEELQKELNTVTKQVEVLESMKNQITEEIKQLVALVEIK